jgi:16S rRNA (guanine1207-N2)-methyltransferase
MLRRHLTRFEGQDALVFGFPPDDSVSMLVERLASNTATFVTFDYAAYKVGLSSLATARNPRHSISYSSWYEQLKTKHDMAIVYLQKSRELNTMVLSMIRRSLRLGAILFLVGENDAGIRSFREPLEQAIGPVTYQDAARHCVLYQCSYFQPIPDSPNNLQSWARQYSVDVGGHELKVVSLPGVFSHERIDKGSAFLLEHMKLPDCGDVLDFGSGAGVLGAAVKLLHPRCNVTMVDSNALAIEATRRTFASNSLKFHAIVPSDVFSDLHTSYDLIVSNPPFHQGIGTDYDMVTSFISEASQHLRDQGTLIIVANRFLRYEPILLRHVGPTVIAAENNAYKICVSQKGVTSALAAHAKGKNAPSRR